MRVVPAFPDGWKSARLRGLRLAQGTLDLEWSPGTVTARWDGRRTLSIDTGGSVREVLPGTTASLDLPPFAER